MTTTNLAHIFYRDVTERTTEKLASMDDYLKAALTGSGLAAAFSAAPALLNAYADDKDESKEFARTMAYALPIGAVLGAGSYGAGKATKAFANTVKSMTDNALSSGSLIVDKIINAGQNTVESVSSKAKDSLDSILKLLDQSKPVLNKSMDTIANLGSTAMEEFNDFGKELVSLPADILEVLR